MKLTRFMQMRNLFCLAIICSLTVTLTSCSKKEGTQHSLTNAVAESVNPAYAYEATGSFDDLLTAADNAARNGIYPKAAFIYSDLKKRPLESDQAKRLKDHIEQLKTVLVNTLARKANDINALEAMPIVNAALK